MALSFKKVPKQKAEKPTPGRRTFRATRGSKFVLFVGDEGAILVYIKGNVVQSRQFVPDAGAQHLSEFRETLAQDTQAPVMMVVDSVDQSYVQQTLPPVSAMSVGKLIQRRLERDFAESDIKGAVMLGREKDGRKDWNFLMIALEKGPQLAAWLDFVEDQPHRFLGIHLVSVEAEIFIKHLERALGVPKEGTGSKWKFFVSHNKVGGFRQVILKNGRIIFTRLAQPVGDSSMEVVAGSIEQEMLNTIEYMKRLSFDAQEGLDIIIVASEGVRETIDHSKFQVNSLHILTPYEVSEHFGIEGATQPSDQFGDVILASTIGCSGKHVLTLSTPKSRSIDTYYQLVTYQRIVAVLAVFGLVAYSSQSAYDIYRLGIAADEMLQRKARLQNDLATLQAEVGRSNLDVEKATDLLDAYQQLQADALSPLPLIEKLDQAILPPIRLKGLSWKLGDGKTLPAGQAPAPGTDTKMEATLTLLFPAAANDPKVFHAVSQKLLEDLKTAFPAPYEIAYTVIPERFKEQAKMEIDFGKEETGNIPDTMPEVQLVIKGDVVKAPAAPQPQGQPVL